MRGATLAAVIAALALVPRALAADSPYLQVQVRAQVVVADAEAAARDLASWAEQAGGHFLLWSRDRVVLRVPAARVEEMRARLVERAEAVLSYTPSASDLREEMARVEAGITSREESLRLVLAYLDEADVTATLALEREIASLVQGLEQLKGTRARLAYDAAYARAEIQLRAQEQTIPQRRPSSFGWINSVDLYRFVGGSHER